MLFYISVTRRDQARGRFTIAISLGGRPVPVRELGIEPLVDVMATVVAVLPGVHGQIDGERIENSPGEGYPHPDDDGGPVTAEDWVHGWFPARVGPPRA